MKKLFSFIICLTLIMAPLSFGADDPGAQFRSDPEAKGKQSVMNQLLTITTAAVGTTALACCAYASLLPSIITFNIGSIIYIASELFGGGAHKDYLKKSEEGLRMTDEKLRQGGNLQREAIVKALENEKKILEFINKRKSWNNIVKTAYLLATILALVEVLKIPLFMVPPPGQVGVCLPGAMTPLTAGLALALIGVWTYKAMDNTSGLGSIGVLAATLAVLFTSFGNALVAMINTAPGRVAAFGIATATISANISDLNEKAKVAEENIKKLDDVLKQMDQDTEDAPQNTLASDAGPSATFSQNADASGAGTGTNTSGSISTTTEVKNGQTVVSSSPSGSTTTTTTQTTTSSGGTSQVTVSSATSSTSVVQGSGNLSDTGVQLDANNVSNNSSTNSGSTSTGTGADARTAQANLNGATGGNSAAALPAFAENQKKHCISSGKDGIVVGPDCSKPLTFTAPIVAKGIKGIDPVIQEATTSVVQMGNALASGNSALAETHAAKFSSFAVRLEKLTEGLKKRVNENLLAEGKPAIDFEKDQKDMLTTQMAALDKGVKESGFKMPKASFPTLSTFENEPAMAPKTTESAPKDVKATSETLSSPTQTETSKTVQLVKKEEAGLSESLEKMEVNEGDVSPDKDGSLFERVSNRYKRSYNRVMEEDGPKPK